MLGIKVPALVVALMATVVLSMGSATADTTMQGNYITPLPTGTPNPSTGGAHFTPPPGTSSMDVRVEDQVSEVVAFRVVFVLGYLDIRYSEWFCGSVENLAVPAGTLGLDVRVDGELVRCGVPGFATIGTVFVTFR